MNIEYQITMNTEEDDSEENLPVNFDLPDTDLQFTEPTMVWYICWSHC